MGEWTVGDGRVRLPPCVMVTLLRTVIEVCGLIPATAAMELKARWSKDRLRTKYTAQEPPTSCSSIYNIYNIDRWTWWILLAFWLLLNTQQRHELFDLRMKVKRPNRFLLKKRFVFIIWESLKKIEKFEHNVVLLLFLFRLLCRSVLKEL